MKNFYRIKKIHVKKYKYEITPYYDKEIKENQTEIKVYWTR